MWDTYQTPTTSKWSESWEQKWKGIIARRKTPRWELYVLLSLPCRSGISAFPVLFTFYINLSYAVFVTLLPYLMSSKPLFQEIWLLVNKAYCCVNVFALDYVVLVQVSTGCKRSQKPPNRVLQKFGRSGDVQWKMSTGAVL